MSAPPVRWLLRSSSVQFGLAGREDLDLEDQRVYALFCQGHTKGIFQFESGGMRDVIMRMRPNRIYDLIAANALYRPGPMEYIGDYVARKHGQNWSTPHPVMTEVLEETYGIMVYQEQVSRMVNRLGGLELKRAFRLAKLISKKKTDQIAKQQPEFIKGCVKNGLDKGTAEKVFEDILKFGGYAFNKAHSTGYALVAFQTAYMKVYWPVEFMAALLTFESGSTEKVNEYIDECKRMGIAVAPPDVNASANDFTPDYRDEERKVIRFGLSAIKGVGTKAVRAIIAARKEGGPFSGIFDFCERVDLSAVNRSVIEALISCGAFDSTGAMRKALMNVADEAIKGGQRAQEDKRSGQGSLFGGGDEPEEDNTPHRLGTEEWSESEMLAREKAVLGFYVTKHPLTSCAQLIESCSSASTVELNTFTDKTPIVVGGLVTNVRTIILKKGRSEGKKMGVIMLEDLKGRVEVTLMPRELEQYRAELKVDAILFFKGTINRTREEPSIRGDEVIAAAEAASKFCDSLMLRVGEYASDESLIQRVLEVCRAHSGKCPLYLEVEANPNESAVIKCDSSLSVDCSPACLFGLADLLGTDRVICAGGTRKSIPWSEVMDRDAIDQVPAAQLAATA